MQNPTTKQPTAEAIETAVKNAAKMFREGYTIKQSRTVPTFWFVIKSDPRLWYRVDTLRRTCTCPYFAQEGICKHQVAVDQEIALLEMEQAYEDYRDMLDSREV